MYQDIVQEEFTDTYVNLTYKTISGLKWVSHYCRGARYVLKIDDHVFVNMLNLLDHLASLPFYASYIMGNTRYEDLVHRSGRSVIICRPIVPVVIAAMECLGCKIYYLNIT